MDDWSNIMYNLQKVSPIPAIPAIFCISLILLGSFFLLNLLLAVIMESYMLSELAETQKLI